MKSKRNRQSRNKVPARRRISFQEGAACPEFGRIRPVHLTEIVSYESKLTVQNGEAVCATRLGWGGDGNENNLPKPGSYLSLHLFQGKTLVTVERITRSCACCADRSMFFVLVTSVPGAVSRDIGSAPCQCIVAMKWSEAINSWPPVPENGKCRRVGSESLRIISAAMHMFPGNSQKSSQK